MKSRNLALCALLYIITAVLAAPSAFAAGGAEIIAAKIDPAIYMVNPEGDFWKQASPVKVAMAAQNVAMPQNLNPAVKELTVRAVHNGAWLGMLIEWNDATMSTRLVTDEFGDQVAVEFPNTFKAGSLPSSMMGEQGGRVTLLQWRAAFQNDITNGYPTTKSLYPNSVYDLYPDQILKPADAAPYSGAAAVGNPITIHGGSPVMDMMAEGFGSLTTKQNQRAIGWGSWKNGKWSVVIAYPMSASTESDPTFKSGGESAVAFAVWDGGSKEVGSRKSWADWVTLKLAQ